MSQEMDDVMSTLNINNKIDPMKFDVTISSLLIGLGAEKYVNIFRKNDIGQCTLMELTENDLIQLGIDDSEVRKKLLNEVKNLPIYEETVHFSKTGSNLGPIEIAGVLEESSQHLYRIYLSMLANTLALKKTSKVSDCLLYEDKYASDIALATLSEMTNIINSMEITLQMQLKVLTKESNRSKNKKIIVGTLGSVAIAVLAVFFWKSLKQLK